MHQQYLETKEFYVDVEHSSKYFLSCKNFMDAFCILYFIIYFWKAIQISWSGCIISLLLLSCNIRIYKISIEMLRKCGYIYMSKSLADGMLLVQAKKYKIVIICKHKILLDAKI